MKIELHPVRWMKPHPKFPKYWITQSGRVWSTKQNKWLSPIIRDGYEDIQLGKGANIKKVHRLVLETFVGVCPDKMECRHLDNDRRNNCLSNLCWGTKRQNIQDQIKAGSHIALNQNGEQNPSAKLTEQQVRQIIYISKTKILSQTELSKIYKVSISTINGIIKKRYWRHLWK